MKYAVVRINKKQYKVSEGDEILVDKIEEKEIKPEVLFLRDEEKVKVGKPVLSEIKVKIKKLADEKGKKLRILKYKAKSRYRKQMGFRPSYSRIKIEKIG